MNKTYRSIWSEADQTWVAASETAAARGKSMRRLAVLTTSALGLAAGFAPGSGIAATAPTPGTVGQGGLELCSGAKGYSWGSSGGNESINCSASGTGTTDGLAFSLNNAADTKGGYGFDASTAQVAGYENGTLNIKGASIMVYGPTTFDSIVTMSNQRIVQLAPGLLSDDSTEAVNGSQLHATNTNVSNLQDLAADSVMYDTPAHDSLTLGGVDAKTPVALHNIAAGDLAPASTDAVNGAQLYAVDQGVVNNTTAITELTQNIYNGTIGIVRQDQETRDITVGKDTDGTLVDLTGTAGVRRLTGLAAGTGAGDAVNVAQMQSAGFEFDTAGSVLNQAVTFDAGSIAAGSPTITLAAGEGNSRYFRIANDRDSGYLPLGTVISNVADGVLDTDATNLGQVKDLIGQAVGGGVAQVMAARQMAAVDTGSGADAVQYDTSDHDTITLSSTSGGNVTMTGLQNAMLSESSTDAVTGQQLFATNQQLASLDQAIQNVSANGTTALSANTTSGPAAAAGTQSVAAGGGAVATGDSSTAIGDSANASAANSVAIGANSIANRANAVSVGQEGSERQIVNVAAGTSGTDAVNLNQMNSALAQQNNAFNQQIAGLQDRIHTVQKNAYAGVAAAMAMPNLTPSGPGRTVVAAGGGYYKGGSAAAVGVTYRSTSMHWLVNGAVSVTNNGDAGARAQVGYEF